MRHQALERPKPRGYGASPHQTRRTGQSDRDWPTGEPEPVQIVSHLPSLRQAVAALKSGGKPVGKAAVALVPTMGALHAGHLALVTAARQRAAHVVVSIFVNPRQFGPKEDFAAYPRQLTQDAALLAEHGVTLIWAPTPDQVYPPGFATTVSVAGLTEGLCGASRPGHFAGVATVVAKLFNQVQPDIAVFGEKDWQQLAVIRQMARDLDLTAPAVEAIIGVPTVREADGLARSSRNAYLSPEERAAAVALPRAMTAAVEAIMAGIGVDRALDAVRAALVAAGFHKIDYVELVHADTLIPLTVWDGESARLVVAAHLGRTRLIDNLPLA